VTRPQSPEIPRFFVDLRQADIDNVNKLGYTDIRQVLDVFTSLDGLKKTASGLHEKLDRSSSGTPRGCLL